MLFECRGSAGLVTLNRPKALNSVTHGMVHALAKQLDEWAVDDRITRVVVTGAGGRAFSAGGDIRAIYDLGRAGRYDDALAYWRDEYILNTAIKRYPKPYISLIDGIVMGGGAGVSVHGSHRVAGDNFLFAMPETSIGLFPDIGATWFLSHMPGETGTYCALIGARLNATDGVTLGIATHRVRSSRFPDLLDALCGDTAVDTVLAAFTEPAGEGPVTARRPFIDHTFAGTSVEEILSALDEAGSSRSDNAAFARETAAILRANAPLSLRVTLEQIRRGRNLSFEDCMRMEYRIVSRMVHEPDLYEGIRAAIIDKDRAPTWRRAPLCAITAADVERFFGPLPQELPLP